MSSKIRATREVRKLLVELDQAFEKFHINSRKLTTEGQRFLSEMEASEIGYDQTVVKTNIIGIAWRINKASKGEE